MFLPRKLQLVKYNLHIFSSSVQCFENKQLYFADRLQDAMKVKDVSSTNTYYYFGLGRKY